MTQSRHYTPSTNTEEASDCFFVTSEGCTNFKESHIPNTKVCKIIYCLQLY